MSGCEEELFYAKLVGTLYHLIEISSVTFLAVVLSDEPLVRKVCCDIEHLMLAPLLHCLV